MSSKRFVTEEEREFVRTLFPQMSVAKIAKKLGRSRACVNKIVNAENLREKCKQRPAKNVEEQGAVEETLDRLKELREMLLTSLRSASPKEMASLAREYRTTVEMIDKMEGGTEDASSAVFESIAKSIAQRMSS